MSISCCWFLLPCQAIQQKMALKNSNFKSCWESISTFFASDAAFKEDISDNMTDMWDVNAETVKSWFDAAAYQSFDVKAFLTLLLKFRKEYYEEGPNKELWEVKYDSGGQTKSSPTPTMRHS